MLLKLLSYFMFHLIDRIIKFYLFFLYKLHNNHHLSKYKHLLLVFIFHNKMFSILNLLKYYSSNLQYNIYHVYLYYILLYFCFLNKGFYIILLPWKLYIFSTKTSISFPIHNNTYFETIMPLSNYQYIYNLNHLYILLFI